MTIQDPQTIFDLLYANIDGYEISSAARVKLSSWYVGYTYGEITFEGFSEMLKQVKPMPDEVFYDLGSGTGKAVIVASLLYDFPKIIGVEKLKDLHDTAQSIYDQYKTYYKPEKKIEYINEDFKTIDISNADIIYINASCLKYELVSIAKKLESLKKGSRLLTNTIYLKTPLFEVKSIGMFPFSWGEEEVYVHLKT